MKGRVKKNGEKCYFLEKMQPYDSTKVDTNKMGKMQRNDHTKWTLLQFLRKSVFLKGRVKKNRKIGKKCHLLHGRVIKMGKI